jgi:hypothetical protein
MEDYLGIIREINAQPSRPRAKISQVLCSRDAKTEKRFVWYQIMYEFSAERLCTPSFFLVRLFGAGQRFFLKIHPPDLDPHWTMLPPLI